MMRKRELDKFYLTVVEGILKEPGEVKGFLEKDEFTNKVAIKNSKMNEDDKYCYTKYKPLKTYGGKYTLVEVELLTGRAHQIRVSMSHIGHPIVGDLKYGGKKIKNVNNQLLHGYKLVIQNQEYKESGKQNVFESPSKEIEDFLNSL